jgi:hypothetical protein
MAIAPIDLQTLFAQLDKVGKAQASHREGQTIQQAVQNIQLQRKTEEQIQQVNEAQNTGEGAEKINDHGQQNHHEGKKNERSREDGEDEEQSLVLKDPSLGRNIDISL